MIIIFIVSIVANIVLGCYIGILKADKDYYKGCHEIEVKYAKEHEEHFKRMTGIAEEAHSITSSYLKGLRYANHFLPPRKRAEMWKIASSNLMDK